MASGFLSQHLANKFPLWSKLRLDPSSVGQRMLSVWADYFDWAYADSKRLADNCKLLKRDLGIGQIYQLELLEEDLITSEVSMAGEQIFVYPTTVLAGATELTRVTNIDELCWSIPTRIEQVDYLGATEVAVYSDDRAGNIQITDIDYPNYLLVQVSGSTNYYKKTPLRNARATGTHRLSITGKDINGSDVVEYLDIPDDGYFWTTNIFTEITEVVPEGFNGQITFHSGVPGEEKRITDPYRICALDDGSEGPLMLELEADGGITKLRYFTFLEQRGESYRDGIVEISPNEEDAWEQYLLDAEGNDLEAIDMAINHSSTRLYVLDAEGKIHIYQHGPTPFSPPRDPDALTERTYLDVLSLRSWARLDEEMKLWTRFVRIRQPIIGVVIKRISPDDTTEYLQADKTWDVGVYEFLGKSLIRGDLPEQSWTDFDFTSEFDAYGQWDFYATVRTVLDVTTSYTAVVVDALQAEGTFDTGVEDPLGIMFGPAGELVITSDTVGPDAEPLSRYVFTEYGDYYMADPINQLIYLRETYDELTLVGTYKAPTLLPIPVGLDETGISLGLVRIDGEPVYNYQRRLILETREPAGPTQKEFVRSLARQVGEFDNPVFRIELLEDGGGVPLAEDPFVEVTSSRFRAYSDYANNVVDAEVYLGTPDGYFLRDVEDAFSGSTYFSITSLDDDATYGLSTSLRYGNSDVYVQSELLLPSVENKLKHPMVKTFYPENAVTFINEVTALVDVLVSGDYYVDYKAGVVYSYDTQSAFCSYTYSEFPFVLYSAVVRAYPYGDEDKKYFLYDPVISDTTGVDEYTLLNSQGAEIANAVLAVHPLTYGE